MEVGGILWNGLSKLYMSIAIVWTAILIPGAVVLIRNRQLPYLRIRNIPLALCAVITLHIYLCLCFFVYMLIGNFPCQTEFWIMSIYLPLGIALYQASNTQLLHISALQKRFALVDTSQDDKKPLKRNSWRRSMEVVMSYSPTKNTLTFIAVGMILQSWDMQFPLLLSGEKNVEKDGNGGHQLSGSWPGHGSMLPTFSGKSVESTTYTVGDSRLWFAALQGGLPASPLWLLALYEPTMKATVSMYWTPPLWFAPSIMVMQGFAIFGPCAVVYKNRRLESETRQIISEWEYKKKYGTSLSSQSTMVASKSKSSFGSSWTSKSSIGPRNGEMYTMAALEKSLQVNPKPLLLFAALKDFSGENISFLQHVSEWKGIWTPPSSPKPGFMRKADPDLRDQAILRREQYTLAVHIYSAFVSMKYSDFPINISSADLKELEALFEGAAQNVNGDSKHNSATPFDEPVARAMADDVESLSKDRSPTTSAGGGSEDIYSSPEKRHYSQVQAFKLSNIRERLPSEIQVPDAFGQDSFDNAERHVKGLVLTNTWPKFVNAGYANHIDRMTVKERVGKGFGNLTDSFSHLFRQPITTEAIRASA
ncbi:hypothetical protein DV736_g3981, partial [Chaetothyriales sp. CBS 134916]